MDFKSRLNELLTVYPNNARVFLAVTQKPDGRKRELAKPNYSLGKWLREANTLLSEHYENWPDYVHGGRKGYSYITFARPHVGKATVITIDIKDCFPTVTVSMIAASLEKHLNITPEDSYKLSKLLSYRGRLAQGFSTSNFICNLVLLDVLESINNKLSTPNIAFSNYVDDIAISGAIKNPEEQINIAILELSRSGMSVKKSKVKVMRSNTKQIICGLLVNKKLTITNEKKKAILGGILSGAMREESAKGWIANTQGIDKKFSNQLNIALSNKRIGS